MLSREKEHEEGIDEELASFCHRFNLEPRIPDCDDDGDGGDLGGGDNADHDADQPPDEAEIVEQSELDHFCAVLQCAQQIAVQLEKEKNESRKRKTPKQYAGNSLKTLSRRKQARLQLAEKGFLGVFEFLDHQKQTAVKKASNQAAGNLTQEQSAKDSGQLAQEEEESSPEDSDDAVEADKTASAASELNTPAEEELGTTDLEVDDMGEDGLEHVPASEVVRVLRPGLARTDGSWCRLREQAMMPRIMLIGNAAPSRLYPTIPTITIVLAIMGAMTPMSMMISPIVPFVLRPGRLLRQCSRTCVRGGLAQILQAWLESRVLLLTRPLTYGKIMQPCAQPI